MGRAGYQLARPWRHDPGDMIKTIDAYFRAPGYVETIAWTFRNQADGLERIECPVTIAWGARDRILPPRQASRFTERIAHATISSLGGCGHVPMTDDAELVARVILETSALAPAAAKEPPRAVGG
jgi:pimeloyl-ACP methyl ester carboxylesterase